MDKDDSIYKAMEQRRAKMKNIVNKPPTIKEELQKKIRAPQIGRRIEDTSKETVTKALERQVRQHSITRIADNDSLNQSPQATSEIDDESSSDSDSKVSEKRDAVSNSGSFERNIIDLTFHISDTELSMLKSDTNIKKVLKQLVHPNTDYMPMSEFERVVKKLYKCCLKSVTDFHELHLRRLMALPLINDIILRADAEYISTAHIVHMVWSVMSCLHHFQLRLKSGSNRLVMYKRQRMVDKCMDYYLLLIRMFKPKMHRIILSSIITFYKDGKLWDIEFACTDMIVALLAIYNDVEDGVNDLLDCVVHTTSGNIFEGQKMMEVVFEVLRFVKWPKISRKLIDRLILMLEISISPTASVYSLYAPLKLGIELCIRHILSNIHNSDVMAVLKRLLKKMVAEDMIGEEKMLTFGSLATFAASKFKMRSFYVNITPDLLFNLSSLTRDKNEGTFLMASRIWLNLIDREKNSCTIYQPRIFFQGCDYNIHMKKRCLKRDKMFFKTHRNFFYDLITECFRDCQNRLQMNAIFEICAVTLVEIPCGYTAATFTSIAMSIQEYALHDTTMDLVKSHHLHATALSILSLICYIHKANVFYRYVANVTENRAEWAPHLIPPLKANYEYALHHILWNKPDLFFEDWETRFGLWKCFRMPKRSKNKAEKKK